MFLKPIPPSLKAFNTYTHYIAFEQAIEDTVQTVERLRDLMVAPIDFGRKINNSNVRGCIDVVSALPIGPLFNFRTNSVLSAL